MLYFMFDVTQLLKDVLTRRPTVRTGHFTAKIELKESSGFALHTGLVKDCIKGYDLVLNKYDKPVCFRLAHTFQIE